MLTQLDEMRYLILWVINLILCFPILFKPHQSQGYFSCRVTSYKKKEKPITVSTQLDNTKVDQVYKSTVYEESTVVCRVVCRVNSRVKN